MESPELVLCNKTERVTIFKIPPLATSKGYYLDDWKEMIWEGGVKVTEKNRLLKIAFVDKHGKVFGETKVPHNYKEAIVKTNDSSRGYAVRLENPKGGFLWVGVAFRDRNDAFDFGVVFQDEANRNKMYLTANAARKTPIC
jgi:hypothetical protein